MGNGLGIKWNREHESTEPMQQGFTTSGVFVDSVMWTMKDSTAKPLHVSDDGVR